MTDRLRKLARESRELEARLREGGGADKIARQHSQGKLTARERVARLCDPDSRFLEIGLLVAWDRYDGQAPAAGVVTGIGKLFGPGTPTTDLIDYIKEWFVERERQEA